MHLPPRNDDECETYSRWSQDDPGAREYEELAAEALDQRLPEFVGAAALEELAHARVRELGIDISRELGTDIDGYRTPDLAITGSDREAEALAQIAQAREQDQELVAGHSADLDRSPADGSPAAVAGERVHTVCPPCGLDWEGPAQAWDSYLEDRHNFAHQKGTGGLSASARLTVERRAAHEVIAGTGAGQREAGALARIAEAREQDHEADRDPGPPI
jgi:hypothetical protein